MDKKITLLLMELCIPAGNLGFKYLITGIKEVAADEDKLRCITKLGGLYDIIANTHNTTPSRVERAIRHAIETSVLVADKRVLSKYLGNVKANETNRNFIAALAIVVKSWQEA